MKFYNVVVNIPLVCIYYYYSDVYRKKYVENNDAKIKYLCLEARLVY